MCTHMCNNLRVALIINHTQRDATLPVTSNFLRSCKQYAGSTLTKRLKHTPWYLHRGMCRHSVFPDDFHVAGGRILSINRYKYRDFTPF